MTYEEYLEERGEQAPEGLAGATHVLQHLGARLECLDFEPDDANNAWILPLVGTGWVYFARAEGTPFIKIGFTGGDDPHARIAQLQTSSPHDLVLVAAFEGTQQEEAALHKKLAHLRARGEWFTLTNWEASFIARRGWTATAFDLCECCARPVSSIAREGCCWKCYWEHEREEQVAEAAEQSTGETLQ